MRPLRSTLIALGAAGALVLGVTGVTSVAEAQESYIVNSSAVCNTTTGEYDVTAAFANNSDDLHFVSVFASWESAADSGEFSVPNFTLPSDGDHDVTYSVPGDSTSADLRWSVTEFESSDHDSLELNGDCVAAETTTTTAAPTTTSTTAEVAAVTATPSYTG